MNCAGLSNSALTEVDAATHSLRLSTSPHPPPPTHPLTPLQVGSVGRLLTLVSLVFPSRCRLLFPDGSPTHPSTSCLICELHTPNLGHIHKAKQGGERGGDGGGVLEGALTGQGEEEYHRSCQRGHSI